MIDDPDDDTYADSGDLPENCPGTITTAGEWRCAKAGTAECAECPLGREVPMELPDLLQ